MQHQQQQQQQPAQGQPPWQMLPPFVPGSLPPPPFPSPFVVPYPSLYAPMAYAPGPPLPLSHPSSDGILRAAGPEQHRTLMAQVVAQHQQLEYSRQLQHAQVLAVVQAQREQERHVLKPQQRPQETQPLLPRLHPVPVHVHAAMHASAPPPPVVPLGPPFARLRDSLSTLPSPPPSSLPSTAGASISAVAPPAIPIAAPPSPVYSAGTSPSSSQQSVLSASPKAAAAVRSTSSTPTFLASVLASAVPIRSSSLSSLPFRPASVAMADPQSSAQRPKAAGATELCALCRAPLSADDSGPSSLPCRCAECGLHFHSRCARLKDVDGKALCTRCRHLRRKRAKELRHAKKHERDEKTEEEKKEEEQEEEEEEREEEEEEAADDGEEPSKDEAEKEGASDESYEDDDADERRGRGKKRRRDQDKSGRRQRRLDSSGRTQSAPSAPPSRRSLTSADPASAHVESFSDFLTAFTESYSAEQQHLIPFVDRSSSDALDWSTLNTRLRMCAQKHVLAMVDVELLSRLLPFLLTSMEEAGVCALLQPAAPLDGERLQVLLKGLDGALMTLLVMTQKGIERTLMREELLDGVVACIVHTVKRNILPLNDPALRDRPARAADDDSAKADEDDGIDDEDNDNEDDEEPADVEATPSKKSKPSKPRKKVAVQPAAETSAVDASWWKSAEGAMKDAVKKVELLLSLLESYIRSEATRDQQVLPLIDLALLVLGAEHCTKLQISVLPLLVAIFLHGDEARRNSIIDGVVGAFRAAAVKKMQRTFPLQYPPSASFRSQFAPMASSAGAAPATFGRPHIQMLVALTLQLIHSISGALLQQPQLQAQHEQQLQQLLSTSSSSLPASAVASAETRAFACRVKDEHAMTAKASWYFVQAFLERMQPTSTGSMAFKHTQAMVRAVLDDLLLVLFLPEWPAAEQLLHCFVARMCGVLDRPKGADKTSLNSDRLHLLCIAALGVVCQQVKAHEVQTQRAPMVIRPQRAIDNEQPATPHAANEITDCICGYRKVGGGAWTPSENGDADGETAEPEAPVAGVAEAWFVDCDRCHTWMHGACVGFKSQEEVMAGGTWLCESCTLREAVEEQRLHMETRIRQHSADLSAFQDDSKTVDLVPSSLPDEGAAVSTASADEADSTKASELVLRQLLVNYLDALSAENVKDALVFARQFHVAQWLSATVREEERRLTEPAEVATALQSSPDVRLCLVNWAPPSAPSAVVKDSAPTLSREGQFRLSRQLACGRELVLSIPVMLDKLLVKCTDPQPSTRAKAVAAVSGVVKVEPAILQHVSVKQAMLERVMDPSTSTREAVVDLIGSQIKYQPAIFAEYYATIIGRVNDVGISVRKRVVRLLQEFLLHPALKGREDVQSAYRDMVSHLIERLRDEETVQKLVRDTFFQLWFNDRDDAIVHRQVSRAHIAQLERRSEDGASGQWSYSPAFQLIVRRIMESVSEVSTMHSGAENLIDIVTTLMEHQESGGKPGGSKSTKARRSAASSADASELDDSKRAPNSIRSICADVCGCIVEQLTRATDDAPVGIAPSSSFSTLLLSGLTTLHFFSRVYPAFLTAHATALQPYMAHWNDRVLQPAVEKLIDVFSETLPLIRAPTPRFLERVQADLQNVVLKASSLALVSSAIPCLIVLTSLTGKRDVLMKLTVHFHNFLVQHAPRAEAKTVAQEGNVIRSLLSLGLLLKHFPDDDYARLSTAATPTVDAVFALFQRYIALCPVKVRIFGLKGLIALFTRKPTLITKSGATVTRGLGADAAPELQLTTLQSLRAFLQSEDARLQRAQKIDRQRAKVALKKEQSADADEAEEEAEAADDEAVMVEDLDAVHSMIDHHGGKRWLDSRIEVSDFLPALITLCEQHVYALCFSPVAAVRGEALAFTNVFLHQAVTNPADAMPTVVALLFDRSTEPPNAAQALSILQSLAEKKKEYHHFIEQRWLHGVRLGHTMQVQLWANVYDPLHRAADSIDSGVSYDSACALYGLLKKSHAQRKQIASALVNDMAGQLGAQPNPTLPTALNPITHSSSSSSHSPSLTRSPSTPLDPRVSPSPSPSSGALATSTAAAVVDPSPTRGKFGLLCFLAAFVLQMPCDDDEPLHYVHHLSRLINTRGAALLASLDDTVQALRTLEERISVDPALRPSLLPAAQQHVTELMALCDRVMAMSVLLHLRQTLVAAYQIDSRYDEWNIHSATAKAGVKLSRRSDVRLSFKAFPWRSDDDERRGVSTVGVEMSPPVASPLKRTPSRSGSSSRRSTPQHSRQGSEAAVGEEAAAVGLIPAQLLRQWTFFTELMNGAPVCTSSAAPPSKARARARAKRSRLSSDADSVDDEQPLPPAQPTPTTAAASDSATRKRRAAEAAPRKARKKRRSLTFGHDRLENSQQSEEAEEEEDDEDDEDWEDDCSAKRKPKGKVTVPQHLER